jgi:REP element-mobilizing transposase RayT
MGTRHHVALENQAYFVTARTAQRTPLFRDRSVAELLLQELQRCRERLGFLLLSFVVMPDHVHLLLVPGSSADLSRVMQHIKGGFGRVLNVAWGSSGAVWQQRFFEGRQEPRCSSSGGFAISRRTLLTQGWHPRRRRTHSRPPVER